ncbi:MAG: hypothetical protein KDI66_21155 [Xanthomonadales bacterium]|nr:hypothetical protein [Xanthomonadales bacterium]
MLAWRWQADIGQSAGVDYGNMAVPELGQATEITADAGAALAQTSAPPRQTAAVPTPISRPPKDAAVALDAPALGYRVSAAQRADDMARLVAADDLAPLLAEFKRRAAQGDADAAARMRDIYDECMGVDLYQGPSSTTPGASRTISFPGSLPLEDPRRQAAMQIGNARCAGVLPPGDRNARISQLGQSVATSRRLAADLGHLPSRVGLQPFGLDRALWAREQRPQALALLRDGSPEALFALTGFAGFATPYSEQSWTLAACAQGYPCEQSPFLRNFWCVQFGTQCDVSSFPEHIRQSSSARDWRRYQAERDQILARLQAGDLGALLLPDEATGGGG